MAFPPWILRHDAPHLSLFLINLHDSVLVHFLDLEVFAIIIVHVCSATWACVQCKTAYDLEEIEQSLLDAVHRKSMAYVLQDLKCEKCHGVGRAVSVFILVRKLSLRLLLSNPLKLSSVYLSGPSKLICKFVNFLYPTLPASFGRDTKCHWSPLSGVHVRGSKRSHTWLLWTP